MTRISPLRRGRLVVTGAVTILGLMVCLLSVPAQAVTITGTGGIFVPSTGRILDTADGTGGFSTPMLAGEWRTIQVSGLAGIPQDGSAGAISFTATVSDITNEGQLLGRPDAGTDSSMLGKYGGVDNRTTTFAGIVAVGSDGTIELQTQTTVRLIIDVQGYYTANEDGTAPGGFVPLNGKRIVDTRSGLGAPAVALASGQSIDVQITGLANAVPADASGVIVNLIAVNASTARGWMTPYPTGTVRPNNTFHYQPEINTSIQAQVKLSSSGRFTLYNALTTTHVVIDLQGYFTATSQNESTFTPAAGRIYDSRTTTAGSYANNEIRSIPIAGLNGIPAVSDGVTAVVLTLTSLGTVSGTGRATAWPTGSPQPGTTALSLGEGTLRSNTITVPLGTDGAINLQHFGDNASYILDVQGWYSDPPEPSLEFSCPEPYGDGAWIDDSDPEDIECTLFAHNPYSSSLTVEVFHNGTPILAPVLSPAASNNQSITITLHPGEHLLQAVAQSPTGVDFASKHGFSIGDWSTVEWVPSVADGSVAVLEPLLAVIPMSDEFPETSTLVYTLSRNSDGHSDAIATSNGLEQSLQVASGALESAETYYWRATATGPAGVAGELRTVTSPVYSFTTPPLTDVADTVSDITTQAELEAALGGAECEAIDPTLPEAEAVCMVTEAPSALEVEAPAEPWDEGTQYTSAEAERNLALFNEAGPSASTTATTDGSPAVSTSGAAGTPIPPPSWCQSNYFVKSNRFESCVNQRWEAYLVRTSNGVTTVLGSATGVYKAYIYMTWNRSAVVNQTTIRLLSVRGNLNLTVSGEMYCTGSCSDRRGTLSTRTMSLGGLYEAVGGIAPNPNYGARGTSTTKWEFTIRNTSPASNSVSSFAPALRARCDYAYSGAQGKGCVVATAKPAVAYSRTGRYPAIVAHLDKAFASDLRGGAVFDPLTRTTNSTLQRANRSKACPSTVRVTNYTCDEYPFASTLEGAASGGTVRIFSGCKLETKSGSGSRGYSRCMIPKYPLDQNAGAGAVLGNFYTANRVHDGDKFYVRITP